MSNSKHWLMEQEPEEQPSGGGITAQRDDSKIFAKPDPEASLEVEKKTADGGNTYTELSLPFRVGINLHHPEFMNLLKAPAEEPREVGFGKALATPQPSGRERNIEKYRQAVLAEYDRINSEILATVSAAVTNFNKNAATQVAKISQDVEQQLSQGEEDVVLGQGNVEDLRQEFNLDQDQVKKYGERFRAPKHKPLISDLAGLIRKGKATAKNARIIIPGVDEPDVNAGNFLAALMVVNSSPQLSNISREIDTLLGQKKSADQFDLPNLLISLLKQSENADVAGWLQRENKSEGIKLADKYNHRINNRWGDAYWIPDLLKEADIQGLGGFPKSWEKALTGMNAYYLSRYKLEPLFFGDFEAPATRRDEMSDAIDKFLQVERGERKATDPLPVPSIPGIINVRMDDKYGHTSHKKLDAALSQLDIIQDIERSIMKSVQDILATESVMRENANISFRQVAMQPDTFESLIKEYFTFILDSIDGVTIRPFVGGEDEDAAIELEAIINDAKSGIPLITAKSGIPVVAEPGAEGKPDWTALRSVAGATEMLDGLFFVVLKASEAVRTPEVYMIYRDTEGYHLRGTYRVGTEEDLQIGDVQNILGTSPYSSYTEVIDNFENSHMFSGALAFVPFTLKELNPKATSKAAFD